MHQPQRSRECKRPADLVARYGGEEFVMLLRRRRNKSAHLTQESLGMNVSTCGSARFELSGINRDTAPQ